MGERGLACWSSNAFFIFIYDNYKGLYLSFQFVFLYMLGNMEF